jgi:hypothetical protein
MASEARSRSIIAAQGTLAAVLYPPAWSGFGFFATMTKKEAEPACCAQTTVVALCSCSLVLATGNPSNVPRVSIPVFTCPTAVRRLESGRQAVGYPTQGLLLLQLRRVMRPGCRPPSAHSPESHKATPRPTSPVSPHGIARVDRSASAKLSLTLIGHRVDFLGPCPGA